MVPKVVLILEEEGEKLAIAIEEINRQLETVVRPFNRVLPKMPGFRGTCYLSVRTIYIFNC